MSNFYTQQQEGDLVIKYKGLVTSLAYSFARRNNNYSDLDDYKQIGYIGLMKAIRNYKGINSLSTMAWKYIRWELLKYTSQINKNYIYETNNINVYNVAISKITEPLNDYLPILNNDEFNILNLRLYGHTFVEIGIMIGYSRYTARKKYIRVVNKIKTANQD